MEGLGDSWLQKLREEEYGDFLTADCGVGVGVGGEEIPGCRNREKKDSWLHTSEKTGATDFLLLILREEGERRIPLTPRENTR